MSASVLDPKGLLPEAELLSSAEVSRILGLSERTLSDLRYRGDGPPYLRLGHRTVRYDAIDLARWLAGRKVSTHG